MTDLKAVNPQPTTKVEDIKTQYFASQALNDAQTAINSAMEVAEEHGLDVTFGFDTEKDLPDGYGIVIGPINKRINGENTVIGVAVGGIPDLETVMNHDHGKQFVVDAVSGAMIAKFRNAVRPKADGSTASSVPFTVEDFITSSRPEGLLLAYRTFASTYVKALKNKGLSFLTETILRQVLSNKAFAEQQFPSVPQEKWVYIIDSMIAKASEKGIAAGMLAEWKNTRDSATLDTGDVDLSDLDFAEL